MRLLRVSVKTSVDIINGDQFVRLYVEVNCGSVLLMRLSYQNVGNSITRISCWKYLFRSIADVICWDGLFRLSVEISCWVYLLSSPSVEIRLWVFCLKVDVCFAEIVRFNMSRCYEKRFCFTRSRARTRLAVHCALLKQLIWARLSLRGQQYV